MMQFNSIITLMILIDNWELIVVAIWVLNTG